MRLPIAGRADVHSRFNRLNAELDAAARRGDVKARATIKEALAVFAAAALRLQAFESGTQAVELQNAIMTAAAERAGPPPSA